MIKMEIKGFDELKKEFKRLKLDYDREFKKAIRANGRKVLNATKDNFQKNYTMRTRKGLESIRLSVREKNNDIKAEIIAGGGEAYYMPFLELGTSKLEAKPFMRPAIDDNRDYIVNDVKQKLIKVAKKAGG